MKNNKMLNSSKYVNNSLNVEQSPYLNEEYIRMGVKKVNNHYVDLGTGESISAQEIELRRTMFVNDS